MKTTALTVYSLIAAGTIHYVRAASAAHARVRAYKCWGQPFDVRPVGNWVPERVGASGYDQWVRESDQAARKEYYPSLAAPEAKTQYVPDAATVAKLMAMIA